MSAKRTSREQPALAELELVGQWDGHDDLTVQPYPEWLEQTLDSTLCTWAHAQMPDLDTAGGRPARTDWAAANDALQRLGLPTLSREHQSALGSPLSDKPGVFTVLGASIVEARDNRFGSRQVIRLTRIALVPVSNRLLLSARHRDGWDWIDTLSQEATDAMVKAAQEKRDHYRPTSLFAGVDASGRVQANTSSDELALEVMLTATQAYPRVLIARLSALLNAAEERFAAAEFADGADGEVGERSIASSLLRLIAAIGRLERELNAIRDDFEERVRGNHLDAKRTEMVDASLRRTLKSLVRLRADARTTVDMIGSVLSSAQLQVARREAHAAAQQRERQEEEVKAQRAAEEQQRRREQRLARTVALLASVLLIPTLVAAIFGANVQLPRDKSVWETWLMLACMVGLGSGSYAVLRSLDPTQQPAGWIKRWLPYVLAVVALGAALTIGVDPFGGR